MRAFQHPRRRLQGPGLALTLALGLVLAACSSGSESGGGSTTTPPPLTADVPDEGAFDPTGVVKVAANLVVFDGLDLDPAKASSPNEFPQLRLIYGTLLIANTDGTFGYDLAESAEVVDPSTVSVTLREGLTFSDGTPLDAAAVKASIERNRDANNTTTMRAELLEVASIDVGSPTELTIRLSSPVAGSFFPLLAAIETQVVSPAAVAADSVGSNPIGAGPFTVTRYDADTTLVLAKSESYWNADEIRVGGVEFLHAESGPARINALRQGQVDYAQANAEDPNALRGGSVVVDIRPSDSSFIFIPMCKTTPPFDDVRFRQALNYAIDREAINNAILNGDGEAMRGLWSQESVYFPPAFADVYPYDPDTARRLVAEAGAEGTSFGILTVGQTSSDRVAEVIADQWTQIGLNVHTVPSTNILEDFYASPTPRQPAAVTPMTRTGIDKVSRILQAGSVGNVCDYNNDQLNALVTEIRGVEGGTPAAIDAWTQLQELIVVEEALGAFVVFTPQINAYNEQRLGGVEFIPDVFGNLFLDIYKVYVRA